MKGKREEEGGIIVKKKKRKRNERDDERGKKERGRRQKGRAGQVQRAARPHTHPPSPDSCTQHPQTPAWVPLCIRTLLGALQGRWGLQAGGALRGRVPQLRGGITCGGGWGGESRAGWEALWHRDSTLGVCVSRRGMTGEDYPLQPHRVPGRHQVAALRSWGTDRWKGL